MAALTGSVQAIGSLRAMLAPAPQFMAALPRGGEAHAPGFSGGRNARATGRRGLTRCPSLPLPQAPLGASPSRLGL